MTTYQQTISMLQKSYGKVAAERDRSAVPSWKLAERERFLHLLQVKGTESLLEIGAGTGVHGKFFQDNGLAVVCTDLSPEMVSLCREKGLTAHMQDFLSLDFEHDSFDAVWALNCLLHVPSAELPLVLGRIRSILRPGGLFYWGQHGGLEHEGVWPDDHYEPKRFFYLHTDASIQALAARFFAPLSFTRLDTSNTEGLHVQALVLRKPL